MLPGGGLNNKMQLSPELTDIVGKSKVTRGEITKLLFFYSTSGVSSCW